VSRWVEHAMHSEGMALWRLLVGGEPVGDVIQDRPGHVWAGLFGEAAQWFESPEKAKRWLARKAVALCKLS
jgi:hypothetical protein